MSTFLRLPVASVHPSPTNPRLVPRPDISASLRGLYRRQGQVPDYLAIQVRRRGGADRYEIIDGHHRHEVAVEEGMKDLPCWVLTLGDVDAALLAVASNQHAELLQVEHGAKILALEGVITPAQYAAQLSKGAAWARGCVQAFQVCDRMGQLEEVRRLPSSLLSAVSRILNPLTQAEMLAAALDGARPRDVIAAIPEVAKGALPSQALAEVAASRRAKSVGRQAAKVQQGVSPLSDGNHFQRPDLGHLAAYSRSAAEVNEYFQILLQARCEELEELAAPRLSQPEELRAFHDRVQHRLHRLLDEMREEDDKIA